MGWGRPVAVYGGTDDKFDGVVFAFPRIEGGGSIDLEVCLEREKLMQYVAGVSFPPTPT